MVQNVQDLKNRLRRWRWFLIFVGAPVLLATIYYGLIASDVYLSESRFIIKSPNQRNSQMSTLANLIQTTGLTGGQEQANEVMDYIRSRAAMQDLKRSGPVEELFDQPHVDLLARYPAPWRKRRVENLYRYYRDMVEVGRDSDTGLVVLRTKAFGAQDARQLNERLLTLSEELVNELNDRARQRGISEAQRSVAAAEKRVRSARLALSRFRSSAGLLDPGLQAGGVIEITNKLVTERAAMQARLDLMTQVTPENPAIPSMRTHIEALDREIANLNGRAVGQAGAMANKLPSYEGLVLEQEFASQMLTAANLALEQARIEAFKQQFYLERVADPSLPDLAEYPKRIKMILSIFGVAICLYFIGWMLIVGILEHAPED